MNDNQGKRDGEGKVETHTQRTRENSHVGCARAPAWFFAPVAMVRKRTLRYVYMLLGFLHHCLLNHRVEFAQVEHPCPTNEEKRLCVIFLMGSKMDAPKAAAAAH